MITTNIKPLSVNHAWQGKRYKTPAYRKYESDLLYILPKIEIPKGRLELNIIFRFSTVAADWDNPIKPFVDVLQAKYGFNDKSIYRATVTKELVKKGEEQILWELIPLQES